MTTTLVPTGRVALRGWRFHPQRDQLIAEAHARPSAPLAPPALVTRVAALSGEGGAEADRAHMVELARKLGVPEPAPGARWCVLDAGNWRLRWERHTEFSTWTFTRPAARAHPFAETALDMAPAGWVSGLPGDVLVAVNLELRLREGAPSPAALLGQDAIGSRLLDGRASVFTDLRPDGQGLTRYLVLVEAADPPLAGRLVQALLEIETYRLMALLAFPVAQATGAQLGPIEAEAGAIADALREDAGHEEDRKLLARLIRLAGEAEALSGRAAFRFAAGRAYYDIVQDRVASLREAPIEGLQTLSEFVERRLAPAMRTCRSTEDRLYAAIARIARTGEMLDTRVEVAAEATSAKLLASMDRRARLQLRLQRTVEGFSIAAISYYALQLLFYLLEPVARAAGWPVAWVKAAAVPAVIALVALGVARIRRRLKGDGPD
jgi:uncharacterized membrane-anchored protein